MQNILVGNLIYNKLYLFYGNRHNLYLLRIIIRI